MTLEEYCERFYEDWCSEEDKKEFVELMRQLVDDEELKVLDLLQ